MTQRTPTASCATKRIQKDRVFLKIYKKYYLDSKIKHFIYNFLLLNSRTTLKFTHC